MSIQERITFDLIVANAVIPAHDLRAAVAYRRNDGKGGFTPVEYEVLPVVAIQSRVVNHYFYGGADVRDVTQYGSATELSANDWVFHETVVTHEPVVVFDGSLWTETDYRNPVKNSAVVCVSFDLRHSPRGA